VIAHIVFLKPKADVGSDSLRSFALSFDRVCQEIPHIKRARVGEVISQTSLPDSLLGGTTYQVAACLEFDDQDGLNGYMNHPLHAQLAKLFWEFCEATMFADVQMHDPADSDLEQVFGLKP